MNSTEPNPTPDRGPAGARSAELKPAKPTKSCAVQMIILATASGLLSAALTTIAIVKWSNVASVRKQAKAESEAASAEAFSDANSSMADVYREDIRDYTQILKIDSYDADAYLQRATAKCYLGEFNSAIADYSTSLRLGATRDLAYQGRALAKWLRQSMESDPDGAMRDYASAIKANSQEIRPAAQRAISFYMERGAKKRRDQNYQGALADFQKAVTLEPANYNAVEELADMMRKLGNFQGAIPQYDRVIELNPDRDSAYSSRGEAKQSLHNFQGALEDFDTALEMNENHPPYLLARAELKRGYLQDLEGAIEDYSALIRMKFFLDDAFLGRGDAKRLLEDFDGAMADMNSALSLSPERAIVYSWRADVRDDRGDYQEALADYETALKFDGHLMCAYLNRGIAKLWADDLGGALEDFEEAIKTDDSSGAGYTGRAEVERRRKRFPQALSDCTHAIELEPHDPAHYEDRAGIKICMADLAGATADYASAGELDPKRFSTRIVLYGLHVLAGDCQKAEAVQEEMETILHGAPPEIWPTQLGRFLTGAMTEKELMSYVTNGSPNRQAAMLYKAHFAVGIRHLAEGQKIESREHLRRVLESNKPHLLEYELAAKALLELGK